MGAKRAMLDLILVLQSDCLEQSRAFALMRAVTPTHFQQLYPS
jgi:hypothetical protein